MKYPFKFIVCILIMFFAKSALAQNIKKDFKVFNALLFKNTPDLTDKGFSKINLIYEIALTTTNTKGPKQSNWPIDNDKVKKEGEKSNLNPLIPTCLDVEHWNIWDHSTY